MTHQTDVTTDLYYEAFTVILTECLGTQFYDRVLVLFDESFERYESALTRVLVDQKLWATFIKIPDDYQAALIDWGEEGTSVLLPLGVSNAISEASVILNLLSGNSETSSLRRAIIKAQRAARCRFAHMPGLTDEILRILLQSPVQTILEQSELLAWALGEAHTATLITTDATGGQHTLRMDLGGWDNQPLMSPGVIFPDSWGNIPPGETFCCPAVESVNGSICINGSIPNLPLLNEEIILQFENGKLIKWTTAYPGSKAVDFFEKQQKQAEQRNDPNWNSFAELGIGLNPAVTVLTGNQLFDEKMLGTIHIAIGDNSIFGHDIHSPIHHDMVSKRPTLLLDEKITIIFNGKLNVEAIQRWRDKASVNPLYLDEQSLLYLHDNQIYNNMETGIIYRRLSKADRQGFVKMVDDGIATLLAPLIEYLERRGPEGISYNELKYELSEPEFPAPVVGQLPQLLGILNHYKTLGIIEYDYDTD